MAARALLFVGGHGHEFAREIRAQTMTGARRQGRLIGQVRLIGKISLIGKSDLPVFPFIAVFGGHRTVAVGTLQIHRILAERTLPKGLQGFSQMGGMMEDDGRWVIQPFPQHGKLRMLLSPKPAYVRDDQSVALLPVKVGVTLQALTVLHARQAGRSFMLFVARGAGGSTGLEALGMMTGRVMTGQA